MLEVYGKIKVRNLMKEKKLSSGRVMKSYKAYSSHQHNGKTEYISIYLTIFGDENSQAWSAIENSYIYGRFELNGVGNNTIFLQSDLRSIGIIKFGTIQQVDEKIFESEQIDTADDLISEISDFIGI